MSVFVKQSNQWRLCSQVNEEGSINDILQSLGYSHNQFYSYTNIDIPYDYDNHTDCILTICLKVMTEEIICVITNPNRKTLPDAEVRQYMQNFVFTQEYSLFSLECDLNDAIAEHNYSIQFVAEALGVPYSVNDTVLYSSRFKYNFIFEGGYLVGYEIADGYSREAHELKDSGSWVYETIESHAQKYHGSNENAINEINIQSKAFYNLPEGVNNKYLSEFANADGSYNFKMLLVTKYQGEKYEEGLNYEDCKCICHNDLLFEGSIEEGLDKLMKYRYRNYVLLFDNIGNLRSCQYNPSNSSSNNNPKRDFSNQPSNTGCMLTIVSTLCFMMSLVLLFIFML